jgi:hypothetical protein
MPSIKQIVIQKPRVFFSQNISTKLTNLGKVAAMTEIFTFLENLTQTFFFSRQASG